MIIIMSASKKHHFSVQDVQLRKALLSDRDAVMAIGDVYEGRDYLWAVYDEIVTEPDNYCLVGVLNGVVMGYGMSSIIDGGLTVVARAGRMYSEYRGQGMFRVLQEDVLRHITECCPKALYLTFCTISKVDDVRSLKPMMPGYKVVHSCETRTMSFQLSKEYPDQASNSTSQIDVRRLEKEDLKLLFATKDVSRKLFPSQRLFHSLVGYRMLDANIRHFLCPRSGVFVTLHQREGSDFPTSRQSISRPMRAASFSGTPDSDDYCQLDLESVHRVAMMTKYFCYPTQSKGFSIYLDIYGGPHELNEHLKVHLLSLKKEMQRRFPGQDGQVVVTYNAPLCSDQVVSCFADVGIGRLIPNGEKRAVLWERPKSEIMPKL